MEIQQNLFSSKFLADHFGDLLTVLHQEQPVVCFLIILFFLIQSYFQETKYLNQRHRTTGKVKGTRKYLTVKTSSKNATCPESGKTNRS